MKWAAFILLGAALWTGKVVAEQRRTLIVPVDTACISSPFGPRVLPNHPQAGTFHYGIDLPAPEGAPVRAAAAGVLLRVRRNGPGGLELIVQHASFVGVYSHLASWSQNWILEATSKLEEASNLARLAAQV